MNTKDLHEKKVLVKFLNTDCPGKFQIKPDKVLIQLEIPLDFTSFKYKKLELSNEDIKSITPTNGTYPYTITIKKQLVMTDSIDNQK